MAGRCGICSMADHKRDKCPMKYDHGLRLAVRGAITAIDRIMEAPSTPDRGKKISHLVNALESVLDAAEHFGVWMAASDPTKPPRRARPGESLGAVAAPHPTPPRSA